MRGREREPGRSAVPMAPAGDPAVEFSRDKRQIVAFDHELC